MMDKAKKEALIRAGYRLGSIREFVGLTEEECRILDEMHRQHEAKKQSEQNDGKEEEEAKQAQNDEQEN